MGGDDESSLFTTRGCTCKDSDVEVKECKRYEFRGVYAYLIIGVLPLTYSQGRIKVGSAGFRSFRDNIPDS